MLGTVLGITFPLLLGSTIAIPYPDSSRSTRAVEPHDDLTLNIFQTLEGKQIEHRNVKWSGNPQLNTVANILLKSVNKSVDPCENYYEYACGNWERNFPVPSFKNSWSLDQMLQYTTDLRAREILEEKIKPDDGLPLKYDKLWYQSCANLTKLEEDGIKPLEDVLHRSGVGWPITMKKSDWNDHRTDWQRLHSYYISLDAAGLFTIDVSHNLKNTSTFIIVMSQPLDTLYESMRDGDPEQKSLSKYAVFMRKIALIFSKSAGREVPIEDINQDVSDVMAFEEQLHKIKFNATELDDLDPLQNYTTIKDFQEFYDQKNHETRTAKINWLETIRDLFKNENVTIDDSEAIHVSPIIYFERLSNLLDKVPNRVIVNYLHWRFLIYSLESTDRQMIDLAVEVALEHRGFKTESERWLTCLSDMLPRYGLMQKYVNKYFSEDIKKMTLEVALKVQKAMVNKVEESTWLDNVTKKKITNKLNKMSLVIGYSQVLNNATFMDHIYDGFTIGSNYCENLQNYQKYMIHRNLKQLRTYDDKDIQKGIAMDPLIVNAMYMPYTNSFIITAAQLTTPFFNALVPRSLNYGSIGTFIGHEITHSMDDDGRLYDEYGNMHPWWPNDMIKEYTNRSQCFVNQYNSYKLEGKLTLGENMADIIGTQIAYEAYKSIHDSKANSVKLPGFEELNDDQLFFLTFAVSYCESTTPQYLQAIKYDVHTQGKYRIIGTLSDSESFAEAYNCPRNSPMNPSSKCHIWK